MAYISNRPTKEKREIYNFLERHKHQGGVSIKPVKSFLQERGLNAEFSFSGKTASRGHGEKSRINFYNIKNKRGTTIANIGLKNKKSPRIVHWSVN